MAKMTGVEEISQIPSKVLLLYQAVNELLEEGTDPGKIHVSTITDRAGIGKGTAYEYFDSKDEIVVHSVVYQMLTEVNALERGLMERESFREQLNFLLDEVDANGNRDNCFLRLVHLLTDNSDLSCQVKKMLESKECAQYRPEQLFRKVLGAAVERGELNRDLPLDYMVYSMGARVLAYMVSLNDRGLQIDHVRMRELVYDGILAELC